MRCKIIFCLIVAIFLIINPIFASVGWIYSTGGAAYYSTVYESESTRPFTWSGDVINGLIHGYGVQTFHSNGKRIATYEGNMMQGCREGYGVLNWMGLRYEGEWLRSRYHGNGI